MGIGNYKLICNLKKGIAASMAVTFLMSLSACSSSDGIKDTYDDILGEEVKPVQLNFYAMDYGRGLSKEVDKIMKEIEVKLSDTIKVKPKINLIAYEKYDEEIKTLISSGKDIDAFASFGTLEDYAKDITEIFPKYAPDYYKELMSNEVGKEAINYSSIDGKIFSVPNNNFSCPRYFIAARKDLVDKYSKDGFETLEDYEVFLKCVKENEPNLVPGIVYSRTFFDAYMKGNGYYEYTSNIYLSWENKEKGVYLIEDTGEFEKAYSMLKNWRKNEYAPKNPETYNYNPYYISNSLLASQLIDIEELKNLYLGEGLDDYEYRIYPLYMNQPQILRPSSQGVTVASNSKNAEKVLMFIEWLHQAQENYDLLRYGIKDRHYSLDGENLIYPKGTEGIESWSSITEFFSDYRYERTCFIDTNNYREALKEASLNNVKTYREVFSKNDDNKRDEEESKKLIQEWESIMPISEKYSLNMRSFHEQMDKGSVGITPEKLKQMQKEAGKDRMIGLFNNILKR